ncbi:MAG TPA: HAD-IC family P-type ATPase [Bryobacteraceae bacterium]|nr:HAD-IC family P-type ATPase [Bryobacteraceae bacterium]
MEDSSGLTTQAAADLLSQYGPNAVPEESEHPVRALLRKFWDPIPWMLEGATLLQLLTRRNMEAAVTASLLVFNAGLSFVQERHAKRALAVLRRQLAIQVRVRRDNIWQRLPSERLVPGDLIHLRTGDIAPADSRLLDGGVLVDHSAVTGESAPANIGPGGVVYTGGFIRHGEASALVTATGTRTYFGKAAQLVREAKPAGHLQRMIFTIVKYLVAFDAVLAALVLVWALLAGISPGETVSFCLMLLVASIPVALPATFTLASALGTQELAARGVLVSRLSAIEEAAAMDVLATDKTGTLTTNELSLGDAKPVAPWSGRI